MRQRQADASKTSQQQAKADGVSDHGPIHPMLQLQQRIGNNSVTDMLAPRAKGADEADSASASVQQILVQRQYADTDDMRSGNVSEGGQRGSLSNQIGSDGGLVNRAVATRIANSQGGGNPLDADTRVKMEQGFGTTFEDVRVHTDPRANSVSRQIGARAFTSGSNVYFRSGSYAPQASHGQKLLSHELAHVVQQRSMPISGPMRVTASDDPFERAASALAQRIVDGTSNARETRERSTQSSPHQQSPASTQTTALVQRYQAGDEGHGGIEHRAFTSSSVGMTDDQASQVYFGNWLRDLSQLPPKAFPLINILALGEFGRQITPEDLGTYVPSEHLDNPEGGGTIEDPEIEKLETSTDPAERAKFDAALAKLSPEQRQAYDSEKKHRDEVAAAAAKSGLPVYIERGKFTAKAKLEQAAKTGATPDGRRLMGEALHAVEDYYSHSNFTEAAIWTLYHAGAPVGHLVDLMSKTTLGSNAALVGGLDAQGRPKIITGTYSPGANDWVSRFELIKTEIENGQFTKAFIVGWMRLNGIQGEEIGKRLGAQGLGNVGATVGTVVGGVSGARRGLVQGAQQGWDKSSGWDALGNAVSGAVQGLEEGVVSGAGEGNREGRAIGSQVGGEVGGAVGHAGGIAIGSVEEMVAAAGVATILLLFPPIRVAMAGLILAAETDVVADHETKKSAEEAKERHLTGPTHSEVAKDAPDNPLFSASVQLAEAADKEIGAAMQSAWNVKSSDGKAEPSQDDVTKVTNLVDKFVSPPEHDAWWQPILLAAVK